MKNVLLILCCPTDEYCRCSREHTVTRLRRLQKKGQSAIPGISSQSLWDHRSTGQL